ncbi:MAG: nitroreductase/quinone reductase family protein [Acidimicrobiales bacterium]
MNRTHRALLLLSGGRLLSRAFGMPVVELHTRGRRTGVDRVTMLTAPVVEGDRLVLVASKGGDDRDPDWYKNLVAHPEVSVIVDGTRRQLRARTASDEERTSLWPKVVASHKGYASYERRSSRTIPLVFLEPIDSPDFSHEADRPSR